MQRDSGGTAGRQAGRHICLTGGLVVAVIVVSQDNLVQEVVDTLLDNGIRGQPVKDGHNKVYKLFSDVPHFHYIDVNCLAK
ncbi:hypothetical protein PS2_003299 [Malus domestica]